jgi:hypothetical protein
MAKTSGKQPLDAANPGAEALVDFGPAQIFQDGPQAVVLGPDELTPAGDRGDAETLYMSLTLGDLMPDAAGEVVLLAGEDMPINLTANEPLSEAGIAPEHVMLNGEDVTGLHYYSFESGLTVYSPVDLLILNDPSHG